MSADRHVNERQFQNHIKDMSDQFGVSHDQRGVSIGNDLTIPAVGHLMISESNGTYQTTKSAVPDEKGNLHELHVTTQTGNSDNGGITFLQQEHRLTGNETMQEMPKALYYMTPSRAAEYLQEFPEDTERVSSDPYEFHQRIAETMNDSPTPHPETLQANQQELRRRMQEHGPAGTIDVRSMPANTAWMERLRTGSSSEQSSGTSYKADPRTGRIID